jgi:hypothetical protein
MAARAGGGAPTARDVEGEQGQAAGASGAAGAAVPWGVREEMVCAVVVGVLDPLLDGVQARGEGVAEASTVVAAAVVRVLTTQVPPDHLLARLVGQWVCGEGAFAERGGLASAALAHTARTDVLSHRVAVWALLESILLVPPAFAPTLALLGPPPSRALPALQPFLDAFSAGVRLADADAPSVQRARGDAALGRLLRSALSDHRQHHETASQQQLLLHPPAPPSPELTPFATALLRAACAVVARAPGEHPALVAAVTAALDALVDRNPAVLLTGATAHAAEAAWKEAQRRADRFPPLQAAIGAARLAASHDAVPPPPPLLPPDDDCAVRALFVLDEWARGLVWLARAALRLRDTIQHVDDHWGAHEPPAE